MTYTYFSKITQMAQQYKYCVLLLCTHAMKKKTFLLHIENQLVLRGKIKGSTFQKSPIRQQRKYLFSMKCCRKVIRKASKYMQSCSICEVVFLNYLIYRGRELFAKKVMSSRRIMKQSTRNSPRLRMK